MSLHAIQAAGLISSNIDLVKAAVLGFVEGLTEYLPVSSTGHLLLMERILGWGDSAFGKSFAILIQLGAILALLSIYFGRLWNLARNMFTDWAAARFVIGVLIAFLPAAVIGALAYPIIKPICLTCASSASRSSLAASSCSGWTGSTSSRATTKQPASRCRCIWASAFANAFP
jgi:undecaprenyl pyrophosphate phosphatase UppP